MAQKIFSRLAAAALACLFIAGCSKPGYTPPDGAEEIGEALANVLASGQFNGLQVAGDTQAAEADFDEVIAGMQGLRPEVKVGEIKYEGTMENPAAQVSLNQNYTFSRNVEPQDESASPEPTPSISRWAFTSKANLVYEGGWKVSWAPSIVHPQLDEYTRLVYERTSPKRGIITDRNGAAIVSEQPVYKVGVDKTKRMVPMATNPRADSPSW